MTVQPVGSQLRQWRQRRHLSQLDLAGDAQISARHLSFVETGRSQPSREMILHLADQLEVPMRERNVLLVAAGFAPIFAERSLDDPALAPARAAIDAVIEGHKPYPCFALDRHWNVVASNRALQELYEGVAEELLKPPVNAMRLSLHPKGVAPRIENLGEWRAHLLHQLRQRIELTADPKLIALQKEVLSYPAPPASAHIVPGDAIVIPFKVRIKAGLLSFFTTTMMFGSPVEVTLSELAIESFFPADEATRALVQKLSA
ncbi:MAG TPA: helix-turn-helix transcriptional regulator [Rhizomicrobium sp.]|nr:helix-turn-helix transcriptional regulator [Rhizomicrobium sp.]